MKTRILEYDQKEFPFCKIVGDILGCHNLALLYEQRSRNYAVCDPGKDQATEFHKLFYSQVADDHDFITTYKKFVKKLGNEIFTDSNFLYQKIPTFRVQLPNNKAVGGTSHRDSDYNHPKEEINLLVPLTSMHGSNSIFVESHPHLRDFSFFSLNPGQVLVFDGANLEHGNVLNQSGWTRVSFDFRLLHRNSYFPEKYNSPTVAHKLRFIEGEYYAAL